jgi:ATP-dependent helicase/nuclease subunit A
MMVHQKDQHIWISASAGTGKTKRLSDRYLALLLENVDPRKILCLTFTKAAAAEMLVRIQNRLSLWSTCSDEALLEELSSMGPPDRVQLWMKKARPLFFKVMDRFEDLRIQTIHSFAQSLLASFPLEAEAPAFFDLLDDVRRGEILATSRDRVLASKDAAIVAGWSTLFKRFTPDTLFDLIDTILKDRLAFRTRFESRDALEQALRAFLKLPKEGSAEAWIKDASGQRQSDQDSLQSAFSALRQSEAKTDAEKAETLHFLLKNPELDPFDWWSRYTSIFLKKDGDIQGSLMTKKTREAAPLVYEWMEEEAARVYALDQQVKGYHLYVLSFAMGVIIDQVSSWYEGLKKDRGVLDYDDLIYKAFQLLSSEDHRIWVQYRMDHQIEHILVDEAQDTNAFQWKMIQALCEEFFVQKSDARERSLFVVGDEKQSIYSFQGASAALFNYMKNYFKQQAQSDGAWQEHALTLSYRSSSAVLKVVDHVFNRSALLRHDPEEPQMRHDSFHKTQYGQVSLWPLLKSPDETSQSNGEFSLKSDLAHYIASTVHTWLSNKRPLKGLGRPIQPGDVLILVQKRDDFFFDLIRALKRQGVPVAGADRIVLNEQLIFKDLVAFGRFLLNPKDDYSLAVILKSPLFGLTEDQVGLLALSRGEHSLFDAVMMQKEESALHAVREELMFFLSILDHKTPYALYTTLLYERNGLQKILARLGEEVSEFIQEFLGLTFSFEQQPLVSLEIFIDWVSSERFEIKRDFSAQNMDEVRVMTVHGSKGLEARVVIIADAARVEHDPSKHFWHTTLGGDFLILKGSKETQPEVMKNHLASSVDGDDQEYFRKLYVAMTRAEEELHITGWKPGKGATEETWYSHLLTAMKEINTHQDDSDAVRMGYDPLQNPTYHVIIGTPLLHPEESSVMDESPRMALPSWVTNCSEFMDEEKAALGEASPSLDDPFDDNKAERGVFIHKLLEELPRLKAPMHERFVAHYLKNMRGHSIREAEADLILRQVEALLHHPQYAEFFGPNAYAEVPIQDMKNGKNYRIDRLLLKEESVWILDFKSGDARSAENLGLPETYRAQLDTYKMLIGRLYPSREVRAFILWVDSLSLIEV